MKNNKSFVEITNKEIYCEIMEVKKYLRDMAGKIKLNRWIATTALSIAFLLIGFLIADI